MSYIDPYINIINKTGLDREIANICNKLTCITWLEKIFGRAFKHKENADSKIVTYPKVYQQQGEYLNVLPNDNFRSYSFITTAGKEQDAGNYWKTRRLALIIWGNLKRINESEDNIFIEDLKTDIEKLLIKSNINVLEYTEETAEDVFSGFDVKDISTQYLMYPYFGMRFEFEVKYNIMVC